MSAQRIDFFTLIFPNPEYASPSNDDFQLVNRNISFRYSDSSTIRTLSTNTASPGDDISGLLYVPDLHPGTCNTSSSYVPANVTRKADLPNRYTLVALAPWINPTCTLAYLAAAQHDPPIQAFIFYLTDNGTTIPPTPNSQDWGLGDGGRWKSNSQFAVYAIPGASGNSIMSQLAQYSGNVTSAPHGQELADSYNPSHYIRLAVQVDTGDGNTLPSMWVFLLVVLGILILIIGSTSCLLHWLQHKRRQRLRQRVANGEVDLEALGIKRLTVPQDLLEKMPLYTYTAGEDAADQRTINKPPIYRTHTSTTNPTTAHTDAANSAASPSDASRPPTAPTTPHHPPTFPQPTCAICLDDFTPHETTVRELPCRHIFHPDCVDSFLRDNSSLCPLCKKTVLPKGYCPTNVTNAMVRRERMVRRVRERVRVREGEEEAAGEVGRGRRRGRGVRGLVPVWVRDRLAGYRERGTPSASAPSAVEMRESVPPAANVGPSSTQPLDTTDSATSPPSPTNAGGRREWARQRALAMLGNRRPPEEDELERETASRPGWRKVVSRVWPGLA